MIRSEHGRRGDDDQIIANGRRQDALDKLTEASHKASHEVSLWQQIKGKTMERDQDDQWMRLIRRLIVQS